MSASANIFSTCLGETLGSAPWMVTEVSTTYTRVNSPGTPTLISLSLRLACDSASVTDCRIASFKTTGLFHSPSIYPSYAAMPAPMISHRWFPLVSEISVTILLVPKSIAAIVDFIAKHSPVLLVYGSYSKQLCAFDHDQHAIARAGFTFNERLSCTTRKRHILLYPFYKDFAIVYAFFFPLPSWHPCSKTLFPLMLRKNARQAL